MFSRSVVMLLLCVFVSGSRIKSKGALDGNEMALIENDPSFVNVTVNERRVHSKHHHLNRRVPHVISVVTNFEENIRKTDKQNRKSKSYTMSKKRRDAMLMEEKKVAEKLEEN
ncbi:hypothetical protein AAMO2058_000092900 [Amorphochlora amoebiformis]